MKKKLLLSFLIVLIVGISITGIFSLQFARNSYLENVEDKLITSGKLISYMFTKEYTPGLYNYDEYARNYSSISGGRVTIMFADGRVIGESDLGSNDMENHSERPEFMQAMAGRVGKSIRYSTTEKMSRLYIAIPANVHGSDMVIRLSVPLTQLQKIEQRILMYVLAAMFTGILISLIIAYIIVRNYSRPIKEMTYMSKMIADGRYDKRINVETGDEFEQLSSAFNNMSSKLEVLVSDLDDKKSKLEAILESMDSGVIAVDRNGIVMLVNPAAYEIFGFEDDIMGKHILDVFVNTDLEDIIKSHSEEPNELKIDYPQNKILRVKAAPIKDEETKRDFGTVVVIQDITEMKHLEQMRSEFVANVSHELKTPLTSIKGFAETLKSGSVTDEETRDKFLDIIDVEANRLARLIDDIMTISELENSKYNASFEILDMNKVLTECDYMLKSLAMIKNIDIQFIKDTGNPCVMGNFDKVKQLMINLIDNAIKYTPEGGSVKAKISHDEINVYFEVMDTGIGIPKEHIPRLFERFYRVDKSRSRALGGTGLGLAIVKHIASSMNGEVSVESEVGVGTKFTVKLPKVQHSN